MNVRKAKHGWIFTLVFTLISIAYVFPIALVVINSFKTLCHSDGQDVCRHRKLYQGNPENRLY